MKYLSKHSIIKRNSERADFKLQSVDEEKVREQINQRLAELKSYSKVKYETAYRKDKESFPIPVLSAGLWKTFTDYIKKFGEKPENKKLKNFKSILAYTLFSPFIALTTGVTAIFDATLVCAGVLFEMGNALVEVPKVISQAMEIANHNHKIKKDINKLTKSISKTNEQTI